VTSDTPKDLTLEESIQNFEASIKEMRIKYGILGAQLKGAESQLNELYAIRDGASGSDSAYAPKSPHWISPGEFRGKFPKDAVVEYLRKRVKHEGTGRVDIEGELLPRLLAGGAHIKGDNSKPVRLSTIKAAIKWGTNQGIFRYDKKEDWVQLSEWAA
jgi:hypothetical protein